MGARAAALILDGDDLTVAEADEYVIRVRAVTPPQSVAQNIRRSIFVDHRMPAVRGIGAGAVAQACKGIAIARGLVATQGYDLIAIIGFETVIGEDDKEVTAQIFRLALR